MNKLLTIRLIGLLSLSMGISCQSKHLCQALKDNNHKIDYSLNVPNGTFHNKFIVIKDHYWELEYKEAGNTNNSTGQSSGQSSTSKGEVVVKNPLSKQSDWLSPDYQLAFAVRYGSPEDPRPDRHLWTQNTIGLVNINTQTTDWNFFALNADQLTSTAKKNSFQTNFVDFKPQLAFNSYSRQERNSIVFMEQKLVKGRLQTRTQAYNLSDPVVQWNNETNDPWFQSPQMKRPIVPPAVRLASALHHLKGVFGVLLSGANDTERNGTIMLVERCVSNGPVTDPCNGNISYVYCITAEADLNPLADSSTGAAGACHGGRLRQLIDCSKNATTSTPLPPTQPNDPTGGTDGRTDGSTDGGTDSNTIGGTNGDIKGSGSQAGSSSGPKWWLWILIVIIIIILIICVILVIICLKKKKKPSEEDGLASGAASKMESKPSSTMASKRSGVSGVTGIPSSVCNMAQPSVRSSIK